MSQTFDPDNSGQAGESKGGQGSAAGHGQGYPYGYPAPQGYPAVPGHAGGSWYGGGAGYGSEPPMPPPPSHKRGPIATRAAAPAAPAPSGGLVRGLGHPPRGARTPP